MRQVNYIVRFLIITDKIGEKHMKCPECGNEYTKEDFTGYVGENDLSVEIVCSECGCECHIGTATQADFDA